MTSEVKGSGSEPYSLGLNPGSLTYWLMGQGKSLNPLNLSSLTYKMGITRVAPSQDSMSEDSMVYV